MREQYLIHWRTKGSKNGERRYQYKDGTYTPLGKLRRRVDSTPSDIGSQPNQKKEKNQSNPPKYDTVFKDASKLSASIQKIKKVKTHNEKVDARNAKIDKMTDKELEEVNKRLGLEKRYKELLDSKASEKAKVEVSDILEAFGNTVAVIQDFSAIGRAITQEKDN